MKGFLFILFIFPAIVPLSADIRFVGNCGNLEYKLNIPTDNYFGGQCVSGKLFVYNDKRIDEIQSIYSDPLQSTWIDVYDSQNFKVLDSFDSTLNDGYVRLSGYDYIYRLLALLVGFSIMFAYIIILGAI